MSQFLTINSFIGVLPFCKIVSRAYRLWHFLLYLPKSIRLKFNSSQIVEHILNASRPLSIISGAKAIDESNVNMERGIQSMTDAHGLCLQDFVSAGSNNGSNDHLHNHHNLHDSVASAVSVASQITSGLMSTANNNLNHLSHDANNQHHHHHHHSITNTPALHEPLEKLKRKLAASIFLHFITSVCRNSFFSHV